MPKNVVKNYSSDRFFTLGPSTVGHQLLWLLYNCPCRIVECFPAACSTKSIFLFLAFKVPDDINPPSILWHWSPHASCYAQSFSLFQDRFLVFCFIGYVLFFSPHGSLFALKREATFIKYILCTMTGKDRRDSLCFQETQWLRQ